MGMARQATSTDLKQKEVLDLKKKKKAKRSRE